MMEFLTYKKFNEKERADVLTQVLSDNGIEFELTADRESLDSLYGDKLFKEQFFVKLKKSDFKKADSLLLEEISKDLDNVDKDHYLYNFTDEELFDILSKPDEWNDFDYQLSQRILKDRGKLINADIIDLLKRQRINELAKPEEGQRNWIFAGYIFALLGGLLGIFIGWHLSTFKKTLPNGERVYAHTDDDRRQGRRILVIGVIMFVAWLMVRILRSDYE
jgi:hypothetical protein